MTYSRHLREDYSVIASGGITLTVVLFRERQIRINEDLTPADYIEVDSLSDVHNQDPMHEMLCGTY